MTTTYSPSPIHPTEMSQSSTPQDPTFSQLLAQWQAANALRLKGGTQQKYAQLISTHIGPHLGHIRLSELTVPQINAFLRRQAQQGRRDGRGGLAPSYVRSLALIITSALRYADSEGLPAPRAGRITKPTIPRHELAIFSLDEQALLERAIWERPSPTGVGVMISLYTGLRLGEICALSWEDVDLTQKTIYVRHTIARVPRQNGESGTTLVLDEPKTPASKRHVPIASPLEQLLQACQRQANGSFVASGTNAFVSPRTFDDRYRRLLAQHQLPHKNYHALRHTFATRCIEAGVDVKSLSEILGHAGVSVTLNTYVHSSMSLKQSQVEKLSRFIHPCAE